MDDASETYEAESPDPNASTGTPKAPEPDKQEMELVSKLLARIAADKKHHAPAFKQMREDMTRARDGASKKYPESFYRANITGRHINQKTAALYAQNPKAVAKRRPRLDFQIWDEREDSLLLALQQMEQVQQMALQDPLAAQTAMAMDPGLQQAAAIVEDYRTGTMHKQQVERLGKTLEILFDYYTREQTPVDFKTSMKQFVRRTATCGVGYVVLDFQRDFIENPSVAERLADFDSQLRQLQIGAKNSQDPENPDRERDLREVEHQIKALQEQKYVLSREGLVFDFPSSLRVIPDKLCKQIVGFVGARWVTIEYLYTPDEVEQLFGKKLEGNDFKPYDTKGTSTDQGEFAFDDDVTKSEEMVCVYGHFDRQKGIVYYLADGHKGFLRQPGAPNIYLEDFWPVFALTFNEVESEDHLFPPSDVALMASMQDDYNDSRQGKREHRTAARPRFLTRQGALDDESKQRIATSKPFDVVELNTAEDDISKVMQAFPMPGVDPNLYDTGELFTDIQLVTGAQEAQFGAVSKATATESSIAEGSRIASIDSNTDDLDSFLSRLARAAGQVLLAELSPETVAEIAGPGHVWPEMSLEEIAKELFLEVEAGSSGKPNQVQEIRNWKEMLPFLIQMPNISPTWLARESIKRLDDRMDLTEAITENVPAIVAQNRMAQPSPADPGAAPDQQGEQGADNGPAAPGGPTGTDAGMGNNQV